MGAVDASRQAENNGVDELTKATLRFGCSSDFNRVSLFIFDARKGMNNLSD